MGWIRRQLLSAWPTDVRRVLARLREWQFLPAEQAEHIQQSRLADLLLHAYHSTTYYRALLGECGVVSSGGVVNLAKFDQVPLLDKPLLHEHFEDMKSGDLAQRRWTENWSGGSTAEPARFIQDKEFDCWVNATKVLFDEWSGCRPGDRKILLWGSDRDIAHQRHRLRTRAYRWLSNERWLRAFGGLTDEDMLAHAHAIDAFRPAQVLAYATSAYDLAGYVERAGVEIRPPGSIMTSAGTLYPHMRETIERVFKAPVFNRYGSREVGDIACDCDRHKGLHVIAPWQYVEVLLPDGTPAPPGEEGELVVTNLSNYAMPLIRYRIGDMGSWAAEPCPCGRTWPLLAQVSGRVSDVFHTTSGRAIPGESFSLLMLHSHAWVRRYQFVQESLEAVKVYLEIRPDQRDEAVQEAERLRAEVMKIMGPGSSVTIEFVEEIKAAPSGKYLHAISRVRNHYGAHSAPPRS